MKYILFALILLLAGIFYTASPLPQKQGAARNIQPEQSGTTLDISGQGFDRLPASVLSMTGLENLDISHNGITGALPAEIRQLQNLKVLNASSNRMTGVPAEMGQLSKLEVLDFSNNQLTGLPREIANLKNLKVLNLSGNEPSQQDLDVIQKALPNLQVIR